MNFIISMAPRILYCLISPCSTTANQVIHNFNRIPLILGVQLHQSKEKKYSHPISAFKHLIFLRISFGWLAIWLPSNLSSLINLCCEYVRPGLAVVRVGVKLFSPFCVLYMNGKYRLLFYGLPHPFQRGICKGILETIFLEPSLT